MASLVFGLKVFVEARIPAWQYTCNKLFLDNNLS